MRRAAVVPDPTQSDGILTDLGDIAECYTGAVAAFLRLPHFEQGVLLQHLNAF